MRNNKRPRPHICICGKDYCFLGALKTHQIQCPIFREAKQQEKEDTPTSNLNQQPSHFQPYSCEGSGDKSPNPKRITLPSTIGHIFPERPPTTVPLNTFVEIDLTETQSDCISTDSPVTKECTRPKSTNNEDCLIQLSISESGSTPPSDKLSIKSLECKPLELEKSFGFEISPSTSQAKSPLFESN